jgi:signal transduction histidine kinase
MKFKNKILLSIVGITVVLVIVAYIITTSVMYNRIKTTFAGELLSKYYTVSVFHELRNEDSIKGSLVISESPRLKAVAELADSITALQLMREINEGLNADIFILTDRFGTPLVELVDFPQRGTVFSDHPSISEALQFNPSASVMHVNEKIYRLATAPVTIGADILGTITIGFELSADEIMQLRKMTNCDIVLIAGHSIIDATENRATYDILEPLVDEDTRQIREFTIDGNLYLGIPYFLTDTISYVVMKSVQDELDATLSPLRRALLVISIFVLGIAVIVGSVISKSIGKPIERLVAATKEISKGRYGYRSNIISRDEFGFLARKFDEMSASLKEKIAELARLNIDLKNQNDELEQAFGKLRETQEELVKSERLAATGKLTAQLSHEINNPIHNIQSCLETALERAQNNNDNRELIEVALDEVTRMSRLTRHMLNFYRTTMTDDTFDVADLSEIIAHTVRITKEMLDKQKIICHVEISDEPLPIYCSEEKLKQVFYNLILNAKDAMSKGGAMYITTNAENGNAVATFRDTGTGIPEENLNKIFDAFFTTKSEVKGVGLGLSVSYGVVKQHNGEISVESGNERGAAFTVKLPLYNNSGR